MSKHTKGPWFFDQYGHVYGTVDGKPIEGAIGKTILHPHVCTPSCIANARLIAAAPELLEALNGIISATTDGTCTTPLLNAFEAAGATLAKYKREQP